MPKTVDNYVLARKIGSGQYGDVFHGYNKTNNKDVAIKTVNRAKVKGKFMELLQNQIHVLRTSSNNNIIQLYDIKKTTNNIYLILEYCNEGDLSAYLKYKKKIPYQQAIEYFVQILHAFESLVKRKIMHRDFKLPNVLKHNGVIKLADFGFAKLLGSQDQDVETILGSPLNMAPEVLNRQVYNIKADIWSVGVVFYQLIFSKVPFIATNIIDLLENIHSQTLSFPHNIPSVIEDVLRKMLTVDPKLRIQWSDLFKHPITHMLQDNLQLSLKQSLLCQKKNLPHQMSKFYIRNNKVMFDKNDLLVREDLHQYIKDVMHQKECLKYKGTFIKRRNQRMAQPQKNQGDITKTVKNLKEEEDEQTADSHINQDEIFKNNWRIILHHRNQYAFVGALAEETLDFSFNSYALCMSFLMLKKVIVQLNYLRNSLSKNQIQGVQNFNNFQESTNYPLLLKFLSSEQEIYNIIYEKVSLQVLQEGSLQQFQEQLMISGKFTIEETNYQIYCRVFREYLSKLKKSLTKISNQQTKSKIQTHIMKLFDTLKTEKFFDKNFDFQQYYDSFTDFEQNPNEQVKSQMYFQLKRFTQNFK